MGRIAYKFPTDSLSAQALPRSHGLWTAAAHCWQALSQFRPFVQGCERFMPTEPHLIRLEAQAHAHDRFAGRAGEHAIGACRQIALFKHIVACEIDFPIGRPQSISQPQIHKAIAWN